MQLLAEALRPSITDDASAVRALEAFGVPFLLYDRSGHRADMSRAAAAVFHGHPEAASLLDAADRIAAEALTRHARRVAIAPSFHARELDVSAAGATLGAHVLGAGADPWAVAVVATPCVGHDSPVIGALSRRENDVARLIGRGLSTKEIARRLGISPHTARHHTERIFARLGVTTRAGVAAIVGARRARWNEPEPLLR